MLPQQQFLPALSHQKKGLHRGVPKRPILNASNLKQRLSGEEFQVKQAQIIEKLVMPHNNRRREAQRHDDSVLQPVYGGNDTTESEDEAAIYLGPANV